MCRYSKGWWSGVLSQKSKEVKRAKRLFQKRRDPANEGIYLQALEDFKKEEEKAKTQYLENMIGKMDPRKPEQFWNVVNKLMKQRCKTVVQPIKREDG